MILYLLYSCYKFTSLKSTYISTPNTCFLQICSYSSPSIFLHLLFPPIYLHLLYPPLSLLLLLSSQSLLNVPIYLHLHICLFISICTVSPLYLWTYSSTIDLYLLFTPVYLQLLLFPLYNYNYPSLFLYAYIYSFLLYILIPPISILFCPHLLLSPYIPTPTDTHTNSRFILF